METNKNEPTLVDHLSKLEKTLHDAIIGTGEEQPEENSGEELTKLLKDCGEMLETQMTTCPCQSASIVDSSISWKLLACDVCGETVSLVDRVESYINKLESGSQFVPMPELDSLDSYEVKLAVQLFLFLKQRLQKEAYTINCRFDGWQERVNNYPLPMFTDNMTKTTKTVDPAVLILSETNKVLKDIRLEYMKRKGA